MENQFIRGSEWRKWDLHVHTPYSDEYLGDWEKFKEQISESDCAVIGINDYCSVEGYKQLLKEINEEKFNLNGKKLIPVVEFRMSDSLQNKHKGNGTTHFNFHIIFNPVINVEDIESLIRGLESNGSVIGSDYSDKRKIKEKKINFKDLLKKLNSDDKFKDNFLVWLPYDEYGGIDDIDPTSDGWIKEDFIKKSDILGSSRKKQIDFFLWKSDKFTEEDFIRWFCNKKACIKGSDSHNANYPIGMLKDENSEPCEKYCWIKADPTFEGLKQIVYEPEDRIRIQEEKPEEKEDYKIIDKIKFIDNRFMTNEIFLNSNLNSIIGGKSTGKSILLRNIAKSIDKRDTLSKIKSCELQDDNIENFEVIWKDGRIDKKGEDKEVPRKIIYIPQSYLNRLVDKKEDISEIDKIIKEVLLQVEEIKVEYDNIENISRENQREVSKIINELLNYIEDSSKKVEEIKEIGNKEGVEQEIKKLDSIISELKSKYQITDEDFTKYDTITKKIKEIKDSIVNIQKDNIELDVIKNHNFIENFDKNRLTIISKENFDKILTSLSLEFKKKLNEDVTNLIKLNNENSSKYKIELDKLETDLKPIEDLVIKNKHLENSISKQKKEKDKLKKISEKEIELKIINEKIKSNIENLANKSAEYHQNLFARKSNIIGKSNIGKELEFDLLVEFQNKKFQIDFVEEVCDLRQINNFNPKLKEFKFESIPHYKEVITRVIEGILKKELILKSNYNTREAISKLLENRFIYNYKLMQGGDNLSQMSPGKKSFVLLKLLIELDNSDWPILLDQPEDDLDNRSIYEDLVKFIKTKKKQRQIIVVTHNPNVVVGADSEQIIVANKEGCGNENKQNDFEYVTGSLENSFRNKEETLVLYKQGIKEHICDILEGGEEAFNLRKNKYKFT